MKKLIKVFIFLIFTAVSPSLYATNSNPSKDNIIYEYKIITQKKGQSLASVLKTANLTPFQNKLIKSVPVMREAKSKRTFLLAFAVQKKLRLLREVRVTRGNRIANFVLKKVNGKFRFVSQPSKITEQTVVTPIKRKAIKSTNLSNNTKQNSTKNGSNTVQLNSLHSIKIVQNKGQSFKEVLSPLGLSKVQEQTLLKGRFVKKARSTRNITLFLEHQGAKRTLKGLRLVRGTSVANFITTTNSGKSQLTNLRALTKDERIGALMYFSSASHAKPTIKLASTEQIKAKSRQSTKVKPKAKPINVTAKKTQVSQRSQGNYQLIRFYQKKGRSLSKSMKTVSLSSAQQALVNNIPVMKQAKSTRQFNLLFEIKGRKRYLKAANVTRGSNRANFVLVNYKGKWLWSNIKGEISTNSSSGFLRYPINFTRISSRFNLRRRHPITRRIRPHKGVDFKAPHGRSIWAPANGIVTFSGRQRGYGITLVIDHQNGYKTKYAHLSRILKGARKGKRVKKKQIVARLGNTGFSTGAHLHYEVIVNGRNKNPLTVKLPGNSGSKKLSQGIKNAKKYLPKLQQLMR